MHAKAGLMLVMMSVCSAMMLAMTSACSALMYDLAADMLTSNRDVVWSRTRSM